MQIRWLGLISMVLVTVTAGAQEKRKTQRVTFAVEAKGDWAVKAQGAFEKTDGVVKTDLLVKDRQVRVEYEPARVSTQQVARALAEAGVNCRLLLGVTMT